MKPKFRSFRGSGLLVAFITFASIAAAQAQTDGTWALNVPGDWHTAGNWIGGNIASGAGATADFSTLNITEDHVIVLNAAVTIGSAAAINTINGPININGGGVRLANTAGGLLQLNGKITGGANSDIFRFAVN